MEKETGHILETCTALLQLSTIPHSITTETTRKRLCAVHYVLVATAAIISILFLFFRSQYFHSFFCAPSPLDKRENTMIYTDLQQHCEP